MEEKNIKIIKEVTKDLITKMEFDCEVEIEESKEDQESLVCNIKTKNSEDSSFLIGQHGTNLQALQHLARLLVRKKTDDRLRFILDINSYRQEKNQNISEQAREAAREAINNKKAVVMRPMTAYERRLVHMELDQNENVFTESIGEGEERKIVVKPESSL